MKNNAYDWLDDALNTIHKADWYRRVKTIDGMSGNIINLDGQNLINFGSNDYLGLASDQRLISSAIAAIKKYGTGSTGSRLITGHRPIHRELEIAIATLKNTEDAIVFSSGYLANLGAISALVGKRDLILSDRYNHSSLKNGVNLSGATLIEYDHCQIDSLEKHLIEQRKKYRRCLIITDTVFSMDGDLCPLPALVNLAEKHEAMLLVDEAHGTGIFGEKGSGCVEQFKCSDRPLIQMGTLSKALGSLGGYITGSKNLIDYLRNRSSTWIYTTGLSPADTGAALAAINIINTEPERRQNLWKNVNYLKQMLIENVPNLQIIPSESPIICLKIDTAKQAIKMAEKFKENGIFAPAIRPPTVPTSRIRITLMATHKQTEIDTLVKVIISNL
jgi:8-amino-7-oxononanoate synthase